MHRETSDRGTKFTSCTTHVCKIFPYVSLDAPRCVENVAVIARAAPNGSTLDPVKRDAVTDWAAVVHVAARLVLAECRITRRVKSAQPWPETVITAFYAVPVQDLEGRVCKQFRRGLFRPVSMQVIVQRHERELPTPVTS